MEFFIFHPLWHFHTHTHTLNQNQPPWHLTILYNFQPDPTTTSLWHLPPKTFGDLHKSKHHPTTTFDWQIRLRANFIIIRVQSHGPLNFLDFFIRHLMIFNSGNIHWAPVHFHIIILCTGKNQGKFFPSVWVYLIQAMYRVTKEISAVIWYFIFSCHPV